MLMADEGWLATGGGETALSQLPIAQLATPAGGLARAAYEMIESRPGPAQLASAIPRCWQAWAFGPFASEIGASVVPRP